MRVAAIYDIHGNVPALEAVLTEIRRENVDLLVVGGDVVPGPMPAEALDMLLNLDLPVRFIRGNGDRAVSETMAGIETAAVPGRFRPLIVWNADQLTSEQGAVLASWPQTMSMNVPGAGDILFCHATPRNDTELFTLRTPEQKLFPVFRDIEASIVICGHTHMQFDRMVGAVRVMNAGSVGAPYGDPGAYWLLLSPQPQLRRTMYDFEAAANTIRTTSYPAAATIAEAILNPEPAKKMLDLFGKSELS